MVPLILIHHKEHQPSSSLLPQGQQTQYALKLSSITKALPLLISLVRVGIYQGLRATKSPLTVLVIPGHCAKPRPFLTAGPEPLVMPRTLILQASGPSLQTMSSPRPEPFQHPSNGSTFSHPCPPHLHGPAPAAHPPAPAACITLLYRGCTLLTPGRSPPHQSGGESSDTLAGKNHAARAVSTLPTPVPRVSPFLRRWPGAPRTSHLPRARVAAAPPPADLADRPPRAVDIAQPATLLSGRPRPGLGPGPLTSRAPQGSARRGRCDRHLHPGLPKAPIH